MIGHLCRPKQTLRCAGNTLVIFTADIGLEKYAYDRVKNYQHRSMGGLRGLKRDLWEGGHRVPCIVRWPGIVPAGRVSDALLSQIDLYATVAAAVGGTVPKGSAEDRMNQLALLKGIASSARDTLVNNTNANGYAVRHGDWVLVAAKTGGVSAVPAWFDEANGYAKNTAPGELYNLRDDLAQKGNLYSTHPEKVAQLTALLTRIQTTGDNQNPSLDKRDK